MWLLIQAGIKVNQCYWKFSWNKCTSLFSIKQVVAEIRPRLNIKTIFPGFGILMLKIRRSGDRLIFNMGIPILVKRHPYNETTPGVYHQYLWARWSLDNKTKHLIIVKSADIWLNKNPGYYNWMSIARIPLYVYTDWTRLQMTLTFMSGLGGEVLYWQWT